MEEKKGNASGIGVFVVSFLVGLAGALMVGWIVFPNLLFSEQQQPINFSHEAHQDSSCEDCHSFNDDGVYSGIPGIDNCAECHEEPMTDSEDERILVEEYILKEKQIPWKVYAWQPDNVYFSHAAHIGEDMECTTCHRAVEGESKSPPFFQNRITYYSKSTMKMVECEKCHAEKGASNACGLCHK
jgi:hypothetical protein